MASATSPTSSISIPYDRTVVEGKKPTYLGQEREVATFTKTGGDLDAAEIAACKNLVHLLSRYHESLAYDPTNRFNHLVTASKLTGGSLLGEYSLALSIFRTTFRNISIDNLTASSRR